MIKKLLVIIAILLTCLVFIFGFTGCMDDDATVSSSNVAKLEQQDQQTNQANLFQKQPPPKINWSLERDNLIKRMTLWNDPNKISYIYLINYGKVMAFYTIKGKVSSVNSSLTGAEQIVDDPHGSYDAGGQVLESPDYDGSYGDNWEGIFFFTTDGTYVEWHGDYMLCDKPLKLTTPPELVRSIQ